jgi:hypothetical protein
VRASAVRGTRENSQIRRSAPVLQFGLRAADSEPGNLLPRSELCRANCQAQYRARRKVLTWLRLCQRVAVVGAQEEQGLRRDAQTAGLMLGLWESGCQEFDSAAAEDSDFED